MAKYVAVIDGMSSSTAGDLTSMSSNLITQEGVVVASGTDLQVTQADTPALSVEVQPGSCYILRDAYVASDNTIRYWHAVLTAAEEVVITSNSSGSTRVDRICAKINTSVTVDATASNVFELIAVAGTPGAGAPATPDNHLSLATVSVEDSETQILNADITDTRVFIGLGLPYGTEGYRFYDTGGNKDAQVYEDSAGALHIKSNKSGGELIVDPSDNSVKVRGKTGDSALPITENSANQSVASSATPTINTDVVKQFNITALAAAITNMSTNLSGSPVNGQSLIIRIKDNGTARAITWGNKFASRGATLPTTTVLGKYQYNGFKWNSTTQTWDCLATLDET